MMLRFAELIVIPAIIPAITITTTIVSNNITVIDANVLVVSFTETQIQSLCIFVE